MAYSIKCLTLDLSSGLDLRVKLLTGLHTRHEGYLTKVKKKKIKNKKNQKTLSLRPKILKIITLYSEEYYTNGNISWKLGRNNIMEV